MINGRAILCTVCHQPVRICTHRHGAPYAVVDIRTQERGAFTTARDVKFFMWGRDFRYYRVSKAGVVFPWMDGDLAAFEQALEAL